VQSFYLAQLEIELGNEMINPLIDGFQKFRNDFFENNRGFFDRLVQRGQKPKIMVVSCSDSRVDPAILFDTRPGELFVIRNVANLIPPYAPDDGHHGVSAAIEFGVRDLKVDHIIILGHAFCGGIDALCSHHRKSSDANHVDPLAKREFLNSWVSIANPAIAEIDVKNWQDSYQHDAERASIRNSVLNLDGFPWVTEAISAGRLQVHGWWFDMENGALWGLDADRKNFVRLIPEPSNAG